MRTRSVRCSVERDGAQATIAGRDQMGRAFTLEMHVRALAALAAVATAATIEDNGTFEAETEFRARLHTTSSADIENEGAS